MRGTNIKMPAFKISLSSSSCQMSKKSEIIQILFQLHRDVRGLSLVRDEMNSHCLNKLLSPAALLILLYEAVQLATADPTKPVLDTAEETTLIIQAPFDPPLLIRVRGID